MVKVKRRTAASLIAFHFGWDQTEVSECRYQQAVYHTPAVYVIGDDYYAAPSDNRTPRYQVGQRWKQVAEYYGRKIFCSEMEMVK